MGVANAVGGWGSSPLARGARVHGARPPGYPGLIPAGAGSTTH